MVKDYYQILKLKRNASPAEINKAYHQQQKAWSNYLNTADSKGRLKAKQMLKELAVAKTALLKTKGYQGNQRSSPRRRSNRQEILLMKWLKRGSNIIVNGVQGATTSILGIVLAVIWAILKVVFRILATIFLLCLLLLGLSGLILFGTGIYEQMLSLAAQGIAGNYFSMGVVTFVVYYLDKKKAILGLRRIPERQLHYLELLGGWIGAFLAQVIVHHKSSKASYQKVYWLIVFFHFSLLLHIVPLFFPNAIPQKYILMLNGFLLFVSFIAIKRKGNIL